MVAAYVCWALAVQGQQLAMVPHKVPRGRVSSLQQLGDLAIHLGLLGQGVTTQVLVHLPSQGDLHLVWGLVMEDPHLSDPLEHHLLAPWA